MTADVTFEAVKHSFGTFTALHRVDLTINAGEFIVLLGPSGCGKTTLSILGGFLTPSEGRVLIGGRDMTRVAPKDRPTTTMFQDYALFPHMTLRDNVGFGLRMRGVGRRARDAKAGEMLEMVGLADKAGRRPHELSGGQRQRVALARALAVSPEVLLLDEPCSALDPISTAKIEELIAELKNEYTVVIVTHNMQQAARCSDYTAYMYLGDLVEFGETEAMFFKPQRKETEDYITGRFG